MSRTPTHDGGEETTHAPARADLQGVNQKLEEVLEYLRRFERRDRLRTFNVLMHGAFAFVSMLLFVGSMVYLYVYGEDLMKTLAEQAAKGAAAYTQEGTSTLLQRAQEMMGDFKVR